MPNRFVYIADMEEDGYKVEAPGMGHPVCGCDSFDEVYPNTIGSLSNVPILKIWTRTRMSLLGGRS